MNPFNNRWLALLVVAGVLLVVTELVGSPGHEGVLARFGLEQAAPAAPSPAPVASAAPAPPVVVVEEEPDEPAPDEEALDAGTASSPQIIEVQVDDAPISQDAGTSTVSTEPPGPPGVFAS
jgi:hypothetical protein